MALKRGETYRCPTSSCGCEITVKIRMPGTGGLEATRLMKARMPDVKIVILTVSDDDGDLFEAIKSGADGYLLKNLHSDEFFRLLAGVPAGEQAVTPALAAKILREFARSGEPPAAGAADAAAVEALTPREQEVLEAVASGATNKEIAQALYIAESTVKYHVTNIMDKLHFRNRGQAIAYATRRGGEPRRVPSDCADRASAAPDRADASRSVSLFGGRRPTRNVGYGDNELVAAHSAREVPRVSS